MSRMLILLLLLSLLLMGECGKKGKGKKSKKKKSKEPPMENLWEEGGFVWGAGSSLREDPFFTQFYRDRNFVNSSREQYEIDGGFFTQEEDYLTSLVEEMGCSIFYYLTGSFTDGRGSSTIFVAATQGQAQHPPLLKTCDLEECIYDLTETPHLDLAGEASKIIAGNPPEPVPDEIQDSFLAGYSQIKELLGAKEAQKHACETAAKDNLVRRSAEARETEGLGERLGAFMTAPRNFSSVDAEEALPQIHHLTTLKILQLLLKSMCE